MKDTPDERKRSATSNPCRPQDEGGESNTQNQVEQSQASRIVQIACGIGIELFHSTGADLEAYASIPVRGHHETWRISSRNFREWLGRLYYSVTRRVPNGQALRDAIGVLSGKAIYEGAAMAVSVRVAGAHGAIYLDLGNREWQAIEITCDGYRIVNRPPVRFIRPRGTRSLPTPLGGGDLQELRQFVNVASDSEFVLLLSWLVASLRSCGPYPILALYGEQGSAKSTSCRMLRALIDPNDAPLRSAPREARDLMIAATNTLCVAFDNFSSLPNWLSDALCRLSTGGGFATRELYSDGDEKIFNAQRPILMNGITELATRSDLADRTIAITLPTIPDDRRRPESELWNEFEAAQPRILGALLSAVAIALKNEKSTQLDELPRMADFAVWSTAAEPAFGVDRGTFLAAYARNSECLNQSAIEWSTIAPPLLELMDGRTEWTGTATDLLAELTEFADERISRERSFPKRPHVLSGELRRIAPNLRRMGISIEFSRRSNAARSRLITISNPAANSVQSVHTVQMTEPERPGCVQVASIDSDSDSIGDSVSDGLGALDTESGNGFHDEVLKEWRG